MHRTRAVLFLCLVLAAGLLLTTIAGAHPVAVGDSSRVDWFARGPSAGNVGEIARDSAGRGEFVWTDAKGDQRVASPIGATGNITREADLEKLNVTGDAANLYIMAKLERLSGITNDPSPELMVAIDSDPAHAAGATALPDGLATSVDGQAKWEYVVQTQFTKTSATAKPTIYTDPASAGTSCATCSAQLVSAAVRKGSFIEIAVPWGEIGGLPAQQNTLRLTILTHYSDKRAPSDGSTSRAIDVLSPLLSAAELTDNTINAYVELHFNTSGEVFAPLLISEFLPDPPTSNDPQGEWIELFNPNSFDVSLKGYKVGDQAYRGGSQGMLKLPDNLTLLHGEALVIANNKALFQTRYPGVPADKIIDMSTLASYTDWAGGIISLQNQNGGLPFKESLALLDPRDTLVDLVQYTTPAPASGLDPDNRPIVLTSTSVAPNASYDRCPSSMDTNNSNFDFVVHTTVSAQTPGLACQGVPGVDLRISKIGPEVVKTATTIQYTISFVNAGTGPQAASSVVITDTLPSGMICVGQTSQVTVGALSFFGTCPGGRDLSWTIASLPPGASGNITLSAAVAGGLAPNTTLINTAGIASTPIEAPETRSNNVTSQTTITEGPADLTVSSTWPEAATPSPGSTFDYTITYVNNGEDDASDITILDQLPPNVTLVSASAPGASFNNATSGSLIWHVPSLAYQESGTIALVVRIGRAVTPGTQLTNTITVSSTPANSPTDNNTETKSLLAGKYQTYLWIIRKT